MSPSLLPTSHHTGHHVWNPSLPVDGLLRAGCLYIHDVGPLTNQHLLLLLLPLTLYLVNSDLHAYDIYFDITLLK